MTSMRAKLPDVVRWIDVLRGAASAYKALFGDKRGRAGDLVLVDLRQFCCADRTTHAPGDPDQQLINEGRRQVYMRIVKRAAATEAEIEMLAIQMADAERRKLLETQA